MPCVVRLREPTHPAATEQIPNDLLQRGAGTGSDDRKRAMEGMKVITRFRQSAAVPLGQAQLAPRSYPNGTHDHYYGPHSGAGVHNRRALIEAFTATEKHADGHSVLRRRCTAADLPAPRSLRCESVVSPTAASFRKEAGR